MMRDDEGHVLRSGALGLTEGASDPDEAAERIWRIVRTGSLPGRRARSHEEPFPAGRRDRGR